MALRENPFPATAVTTFGVKSETPAILNYMREARKLLVAYLKSYQFAGSIVALSGAHGSGKTFLLSWLADQAAEFTRVPVRVVYAKVDGPSFVDLYQQLMLRISRENLEKAAREALRLRAEEITGLAKATKSTSQQIHRTGELEPGYASKVIDPNELNVGLRRALEQASSTPDVARRMAAAIGLLDDSTWGEDAFGWLCGRPTPLPHEALRTSLFETGSSSPDETAVAALEVVATIFRLASTPLLIMVDQLENLVSTDSIMETSSTLKKLAEQLSLQHAMLVVGGTPRAWKRLPRDVKPRFGKRLKVGNLSLAETKNLLKAYLRVSRISLRPVELIFTTAGGNPREILQTSYQLFAETRGNFSRVDAALVRAAAAKAGTLADREQAALEILDQVAGEESIQVVHPSWKEASDFDRLAAAPGGGSLAIIFAASPDRQAETELGLRLTRLKRELAADPSHPQMLVVAIGYSSDQVSDLLSGISRVLSFSEANFARELKGEFGKLKRLDSSLSASVSAARAARPVDTTLLDRLDKLEHLLSDLHQTRFVSDQEAAARFSALTEASAEPERRRTEIRTRLELREGLDRLERAFKSGDFDRERSVLRSLLVANEANIRNEGFDALGTIYLDAINVAQFADAQGSPVEGQLHRFRSNLSHLLRQSLSPTETSGLDRLELRIPLILGSAILGAIIVGTFMSIFLEELYLVDNYRTSRLWGVLFGAVAFAATGYGSYLFLKMQQRPERRYARLARQLDSLRGDMDRF